MTRGAETPEAIKLKFRAEYLLSGNAADAARKAGIPESTGRDIAKELNVSVDFAEDRRALRAQYLDECVHARMRVMRKAEERAMAEEAQVYNDANGGITVVDKRKDWADVVLSAEKNAHNLAKIERENEGTSPVNTEVHIHLAKDDGEPSQAP